MRSPQKLHSTKLTNHHKIDKINPLDKVFLFKHSQKYAKDYRRYLEERGDSDEAIIGPAEVYQARLSEAGKKLCKKWGLRYPIDPNTPVEKYEILFVHAPVSFLMPPESWHSVQANTWKDKPEDKIITHVDGKLVLMIDTTYPKSQITQALQAFLNCYTDEPKGRTHEKYFIWQVYQMVEQQGKPCMQVAREIGPLTKNQHPAYDPEADRVYKKVKRAHEKARRMMQTFEARANSNTL